MWAKVAEEMAIPWRAAEAMHWQLGEHDMARRAGVVPFSLTSANLDTPAPHRPSPMRSQTHAHIPSQADSVGHLLGTRWQRPDAPGENRRSISIPTARAHSCRREHAPRHMLHTISHEMNCLPGLNHNMGAPRGRQPQPMLPGVAEMTTGLSPYSMPPYSGSMIAATSGMV